jgi:hypothetical protein
MSKANVIAMFCADLHLSHTPPIWRSNEPDWYTAMSRPLLELQILKDKHQCPIFCAGDIFDKWFGAIGQNAAELINFAIDRLPEMFAIPGQHDLPLHNIDDVKKSAYYTLVRAGKIKEDLITSFVTYKGFNFWGFPFGSKITSVNRDKYRDIAIIHQYVWIPKHSYPNAPEDGRLRYSAHGWEGYDVMVFGDNHNGFYYEGYKQKYFNCGTLMRRKSDEKNYKPQVGLLYSDGTIKPHYLDTSKDKYLVDVTKDEEKFYEDMDVSDFVKELESLGETALDFTDAVKRYFDSKKTNKEIINIVLKAMEKK